MTMGLRMEMAAAAPALWKGHIPAQESRGNLLSASLSTIAATKSLSLTTRSSVIPLPRAASTAESFLDGHAGPGLDKSPSVQRFLLLSAGMRRSKLESSAMMEI